jgi:60 kDa SS-A/Ro ribonucleoprotein
MPDPLAAISPRRTPQSRPADTRQARNSAGGYGFQVDHVTRLRRFLTLGTTGGTFYATEQAITEANAKVILDMARGDTATLVRETVAVSQAGRAPRNNPALFALAAAASLGDPAGKRAALDALPLVARTATHLFIFCGYAQNFRGWGRGLRRGVGGWYLTQDPGRLAYQMLKYRQREGWTHRDLLRQAHPAGTGQHRALFDFACGRDADLMDLPLVSAFLEAQAIATPAPDTPTNPGQRARAWAKLIETHPDLTHEMLPTEALSHPLVWEALIAAGMPQTALIRQLPRLTRLGVLAPMSPTLAAVCAQLTDQERLTKARVHPIAVLLALRTYASGHSARGDSTWTPVAKVTDALDAAFYLAYGSVEPSGKRVMSAVDVSGSMGDPAAGTPLSCREAAAALALVTAATEPNHMITGFTDGPYPSRITHGVGSGLTPLNISPRQRLDDVMNTIRRVPMGGTNCAAPMQWALTERAEIDVFEIITDNETWFGDIHPHQALEEYRQKTGIPARLAVVALTPTEFTIADPADPGSLDVSGFDAAVPTLLADFARGAI